MTARFVWVLILLLACEAPCQTVEAELVAAAVERTRHSIRYDGAYIPIEYPGGDVPSDIGVCTDVIIRSYRAIGVDLQRLVHEDMAENFARYPSQRIWGLAGTDPNIDHRRVPNLQVFFSRHGQVLGKTADPADYGPGEIVTWMLPGNLPHIGIVTGRINPQTGHPMIVHNIGAGPQIEDMLFDFCITGHYKYMPASDEHRKPRRPDSNG